MENSKIHTILIIGSVWPEPNSSAGGTQMMQLIDVFLSEGWKITFASSASDSDFMFDVRELGINKVSIELNNSSFDAFIQNLQPTHVLFDRFMMEEQYGWRVAKECPNAIRILSTVDLHCLRLARQATLKENREMTSFDLMSDVAKREIASIFRCDLSLVISKVELDILKKTFKVDPNILLYVPFLLAPIDLKQISKWPSFEERNHFVMIGNFIHEPNWDAVQFLKEEIWPLIRKELPNVEVHVYGAYPSQKVLQLNNPKEGFIIKGRAENAAEVVSKARVSLAPLRFGAGMKGKLVEAMQCGTPTVTTSIGVESMHGNLEWSGIIADTSGEIAKAAIKLYTDTEKWIESQKNGIAIIESIFSKFMYSKVLIDKLFAIEIQLKEHRLQNFTGQMLMHHTLASTRYMSKWIEEKNR